jgi:Carbohydrate-selective porin, OprB family
MYELEINVEQEITKDIGAFLWVGYPDSDYEVAVHSKSTRALALGMQAKWTLWNRPKETFGLAEILDGIGHAHRDFLAASELGPLISDGQLPHCALENVVETYYDAEESKYASTISSCRIRVTIQTVVRSIFRRLVYTSNSEGPQTIPRSHAVKRDASCARC